MNTTRQDLTLSLVPHDRQVRKGTTGKGALLAAVRSGTPASEVARQFGISYERVRQVWIAETATPLPKASPAECLARYYRVDPSGCWIWTGSRYTQFGKPTYGQTSYNGKRMGAHKASYLVHVGPIPEGLDVMHSCNVKACVNPAHLSTGTRSQNLLDGFAAHPGVCAGENNGRARLTWDDVHAIRAAGKAGTLQRELAARYGVTQAQISQILRGSRWPESKCPVHGRVEVAA